MLSCGRIRTLPRHSLKALVMRDTPTGVRDTRTLDARRPCTGVTAGDNEDTPRGAVSH